MDTKPHAMSMYYIIPKGTPVYSLKTRHTFQDSYGDVYPNSPRRVIPFVNSTEWWDDWRRYTVKMIQSFSEPSYHNYIQKNLRFIKNDVYLGPNEAIVPATHNIIPPFTRKYYFVRLDHPMWYGYLVDTVHVQIFNGSSI